MLFLSVKYIHIFLNAKHIFFYIHTFKTNYLEDNSDLVVSLKQVKFYTLANDYIGFAKYWRFFSGKIQTNKQTDNDNTS